MDNRCFGKEEINDKQVANLVNKRILIVGNRMMTKDPNDLMPVYSDIIDVIQISKKLGIYTIVTDDIQDSPLKAMSDEFFCISLNELDKIVELATSKKIDGVVSGMNEYAIIQTISVSELLRLPFYCTLDQWDILQNKAKYKELCRAFDVSVPERFHIDESFKREDLEKIKYPAIIKPVDSSGGTGISVCYSEADLKKGYQKALKASKSKQVILERYMTGEEVTIYYTAQDGYISLSAMSDKCQLKQPNLASLPYLLFFPSKHLGQFLKNDDEKIRNMLKHIGVKNGFLFIQGFMIDGRFVTYEMGFRVGGTEVHKIISAINGVNAYEMIVRHSLTGAMSGWDLKSTDTPNFNKSVCIWRPFLRSGRINKIIGLDKICKYSELINNVQFYYEGDVVGGPWVGTLGQAMLMATFVAETKEQLVEIVKRAEKALLVLDEAGENMLMDINVEDFDI